MRTVYELRHDLGGAIDEGRLPVHAATGVITGCWSGQWGRGPAEFELRTKDGATSRWLCHLHPEIAILLGP